MLSRTDRSVRAKTRTFACLIYPSMMDWTRWDTMLHTVDRPGVASQLVKGSGIKRRGSVMSVKDIVFLLSLFSKTDVRYAY